MHLINAKNVAGVALVFLLMGVLYRFNSQPLSKDFLFFEDRGQSQDRVKTQMCRTTSSNEDSVTNHLLRLQIPASLSVPQPSIVKGRTDVITVTPWLAPVVWEGTFDTVLLENVYKPKNLSIAASVFAVGKYIRFLKDFLETAEKHFFVGYKVHMFVYTDQPNDVPQVKIGPGRQLSVRSVSSANRWQDVTTSRMGLIQKLLEDELRGKVDFFFSLDVDSRFHGHWGLETLGGLIAAIHPGYYKDDRSRFPYERRPESRAYLAPNVGDFYYGAAVFGGIPQEVIRLVQACREDFDADAEKGIEAAWQEESHMNRYFFINKPTKILSPEYLWQDFKPINPEIHVLRFSGIIKNYKDIRPNY